MKNISFFSDDFHTFNRIKSLVNELKILFHPYSGSEAELKRDMTFQQKSCLNWRWSKYRTILKLDL